MEIVSYNIHMGLEPEAIVKNIQNFAAQGVDVFCLQEFWKWLQPIDLERALLDVLGTEWQIECIGTQVGRQDYGLCILWKTTVLKSLSFQPLTFPLLPKAKLWEKVWLGSHGFNTFIAQRGALIGTFVWNNRHLRITTVHLDWQGGFKQRAAQIAYVRDFLAAHPEADCDIICGDFNSLGVFNKEKQAKIILDVVGNDFCNAYDALGVTCPPFQCLDRMLVKNLRVLRFQIYKLRGSDHRPIIGEFKILS